MSGSTAKTKAVRSGRTAVIVLVAAATLALAGLGASGMLGGAPPREVDTPVAPTAIVDVKSSALPVPAGFVPFEAPGITFAHPADWLPSTAYDDWPDSMGTRIVGTFARGVMICPNSGGGDPAPIEPPACVRQATAPGTLIVQVTEWMRQLPGTIGLTGKPTTFAGYEASAPRDDIAETSPIALTWAVSGPDDGVYLFWAQAPNAEIEAVRDEMEATLATLQLSGWQALPEVVDGLVHVDSGQGFSFDYPAGWTIYYPQDMSMMDNAVVTVSSQPLEPPCPGDTCQRFTTPPGTAAIEFRIGRGPSEPDWSATDLTVDGQPAYAEHWDQTTATSADECDELRVRLDDERRVLGIYTSHRGPGIDDQREIVGQVVDSLRIHAPPP